MLSLDDAYEAALHEAVRLQRPPTLRLVRLIGPQREWFLQNTVTADVERPAEGSWVESCFLDPKGRVQAHFRVGKWPEEFWLDVAPDAEHLAGWFQAYRFRTKVEIDSVKKPSLTVVGPRARDFAGEGEFKALGPEGSLAFGYRLGDAYAADLHLEDVSELTSLAPLPVATPELYDVLRIEAGVGAFGVDFGDRDLPQEAGLTRTVSVEKGCYVGQETVARIHFRGHINKVLRPLRFSDGEPSPGAELLLDGAKAGVITSVARSPRKGVVGIGMVRVEPEEGTELAVPGGGTAVLGPVPEGTKVKTG